MKTMDEPKEWLSVPAFGEWEHKSGDAMPNYSVDFSKIRKIRLRNRSHASIGGDVDLLSIDGGADDCVKSSGKESNGGAAKDVVIVDSVPVREDKVPILPRPIRSPSPTGFRKMISYFNCCSSSLTA